ncbi:AI-2E family transporter [Ancylobacter moscoviensis]
MQRETIETLSFIAVIVIVTVAMIWLLLPYYGAILWAIILAIIFNPLQLKLVAWLGQRRNLAAAISVLACIGMAVVPVSLILASLAREATGLYNRINANQHDPAVILAQLQAALPTFVLDLLQRFDLGDFAELQGRLASWLMQVSQSLASRALSIGQNTAELFVSFGIMLYLLFFLFRDGGDLTRIIRDGSPLNPSHTNHILEKFVSVVKAAIQGSVIIAAIQGGIGGIAFWALGIEAALLWGVLMGAFSLLPAIGAALVWAPAAIYLLLSGAYLKGLILLAVGTLIISTIDNLLRPPLVGKGTRLPDYAVLISTIGGISLIGMNGFVVGPLIAAMFIAVWSLFIDDQPHI